jgi:RIO kinase 1
MTVKELFDFVTDPTVSEANMDDYLSRMMEITATRSATLDGTDKAEDEIFKKSFIPYTMNDVVDYERDFRRVKQGENLIYTTLHGLKDDLSNPRLVPELLGVAGEKIAPTSQQEDNGSNNKAQVELNSESQAGEVKKENNQDKRVKDAGDEDGSSDEETESDEDDDDETGDSDEDDSEEEDGEGDENNNDPEKQARMALHSRPRDESPNSKRVNIKPKSCSYRVKSVFS